MPAAAPPWERRAGDLLRHADERIRVISTCTPTNIQTEGAALVSAFDAGQPREPRFSYAAVSPFEHTASLERLADTLEPEGTRGAMFAARARELALEAHICAAVGTPRLGELARRRYGDGDAGDGLAEAWSRLCPVAEDTPHLSDDESDGESLVSAMRAELGRQRIGFAVRVATLAALAATGKRVIFVAKGRAMSRHAVRRTVHHEVHGHALPRWRASQRDFPLYEVGTAGSSDDQEGYALALEEEAHLLDDERKRVLARRHIAARAVRDGADFVETVGGLRALETPLEEAIRIACRVHRGGGLAREVAYLPALLRVRPVMATPLREVLGHGRVALRDAPSLP